MRSLAILATSTSSTSTFQARRCARPSARAAWTTQAAIETGAQILDGLANAHAHGIVHRDVKPANVLLADGEDVSVKLFDFGLAVMHEDEALTAVGDIPGTLAYISPERLRGDPARPAADVWAVGVLLWEALAGRHPFWGGSLLDTARRIEEGAPSLASMRPDLDPAVVECVDRALAVDPKRRPSARVLAARLRKVAPGLRASPPATAEARAAAGGCGSQVRAGRRRRRSSPPGAQPLCRSSPPAGRWRSLQWPECSRFSTTASDWPSRSPCRCFRSGTTRWGSLSSTGRPRSHGWSSPGETQKPACFMTSGPLLASVGLVAALPAAGLVIGNPVRRGIQVAMAVLVTAAVAGASALDRLGIAASDRPGEAGAAVVRALERVTIVQAVVLGLVAVALPFARARGPWAAAGLAAFFVAAQLLAAPSLAPFPVVGTAWLICLALVAEPYVRARLRREPEHRTMETVATVRALRSVTGG